MTKRAALFLCVAGAASCGGPPPRNTSCRELGSSAQREVITVDTEQPEMTIPAPCTRNGRAYIDSPISLRATAEGLHVRFSVRDESFVPGPWRDTRCERYLQRENPERCQRDAVVLFPGTTMLGSNYVEFELLPRRDGYRVDQVFPWSTWGIERGLGRFRLAITVFERGPAGDENETRIVSIVQVTDRRSRNRDAGAEGSVR